MLDRVNVKKGQSIGNAGTGKAQGQGEPTGSSHVVFGVCFRVFFLPVSGATSKIFVERKRMSSILIKEPEMACTYLVQYDTGKL